MSKGNQKLEIEGQTMQCLKENGQNYKQLSTKHCTENKG
jgi:hypothetical protein